ncbi:Potassium uptake protein KtrB [Mycoplasma haemocanis str. Illinois]|uniref:Potassium uptake protein KtrB n=1 Tax=Mycoplasma haemocanis (strain Illinois) TaxID=1111676 RepID=H6N5F4_MYCHN|nr:potassium transporter TrkG [Mycoplasma haemocanis]AEW44914.1 Potassium uptake protein KtrB [Mycoplasma haemocanis str. Illinois]
MVNKETDLLFFKNFLKNPFGKTIYQKFLRVYLLTTLVGAFLLYLPISRKESLDFFSAIFISLSAFSNTGLTTHVTSDTFNFFGQLVILCLIQFGGLGFLTVLIFLWSWIKSGGNINVEHRRFLHFERGSFKKVESLETVKGGITVLLVAELVGAIILTVFFYFATPATQNSEHLPSAKGDFWKSLWYAIFHSVSATNNAGFDILGKHSIMPYRHGVNNILSAVLLVESVLGGIGYPIFYDLYFWRKNKKLRRNYQVSLFTKTCLSTYFFISLISVVLIIFFETILGLGYSNSTVLYLPDNELGSKFDRLWNVIYTSFSARSAGFSSIDISKVTEETKWLLSILMFVGTSPASTGGGIRNITIFLILARIFFTIRGRRYLTIYNKTVSENIITDAYMVFSAASILVMSSIFVITMSLQSRQYKIGDAFFEATSAFGTVGLTSGVTKSCNFLGKLVLMLLMFVGQLGISNAILSLTNQHPKFKNARYCVETLRII